MLFKKKNKSKEIKINQNQKKSKETKKNKRNQKKSKSKEIKTDHFRKQEKPKLEILESIQIGIENVRSPTPIHEILKS